MHYYQFNIGNYRRKTNHLSLLEHGIYRLLIDTYYLSEGPLCDDDAELMRTSCVRTEEEKAAFKNVMKDFFIKEADGYHHKDCDDLIAKFLEKSEKARKSADARWAKDANAMRTHSEGNADAMLPNNPIPNTQRTNNQKKKEGLSAKDPEPAKRKVFQKPSVEDVKNYCAERQNKVDAEKFCDFYTSNGWKVGKNAMKDWQSAVRNWERSSFDKPKEKSGPLHNFDNVDYSQGVNPDGSF